MHCRISRLDKEQHYDPSVSHFKEEKFLEDQTSTIRKLSGYANDFDKLDSVGNPSVSVYLFGEYLQNRKWTVFANLIIISRGFPSSYGISF